MKFATLKLKKTCIKYTYLLFIYVLEFCVYGVWVTHAKFVNNGKMKFVQYIFKNSYLLTGSTPFFIVSRR